MRTGRSMHSLYSGGPSLFRGGMVELDRVMTCSAVFIKHGLRANCAPIARQLRELKVYPDTMASHKQV
jgi:hypothetical protein